MRERERLSIRTVLVIVFAVAVGASSTRAEPPGGRTYLGPYSVYNSDLTALKSGFTSVPTFTSLSIQTSVAVPDRGSVTLGGYSRWSEGRNELGAPGLGKTPYLGRGSRNVGYGRDVQASRVVVGVRIIDLAEEEYRQTGVRSGK
jgi:type II secretory pathway component GspD/PulD (secretin)